MYYVYILKSLKDQNVYIGVTHDLRARLKQHNEKKSFATKSRTPLKLVYYEAYCALKDAVCREKMLKYNGQGLRRLKERLKYSLLII